VSPPCTAITLRCPRPRCDGSSVGGAEKAACLCGHSPFPPPWGARREVAVSVLQTGSALSSKRSGALQRVSLPRLLQPRPWALWVTPCPSPRRGCLWFDPATPALHSRVRVCALPLRCCWGPGGYRVISLLQIPLGWRIPLCCAALPVRGTPHVGLSMDSFSLQAGCSPEARCVSLEKSTLLQMLEGASGKAGNRAGSPAPCPACLDCFPGIGTGGQRRTRVLDAGCGNSWLLPPC